MQNNLYKVVVSKDENDGKNEFRQEDHKYLNDLNADQLAKVASVYPKWVFEHRPFFMMHYHPEWVARFHPDWMSVNNTQYMLKHRIDWMVFNRPGIVAQFNMDALIYANPKWCVKNVPELLVYRAPSVLKEYDRLMYEKYCPEEHVKVKGFYQRLISNLKKLRKYILLGLSKDNAISDPSLPKEVIEILKTN